MKKQIDTATLTHYPAQLGLLDKGRAIKELVAG